MFKNLLLAAALLVGGAMLMPSQTQAGGPHCGPHGHHGHYGYGGYGGYGYSVARPVIVPNYGYGTGVPYIGPSVRYGGYGYSSYRPGLNISIGNGYPYGGYGGYGIGSPFGYGYGSGFGLYLGR